jgi:hypothetical protein
VFASNTEPDEDETPTSKPAGDSTETIFDDRISKRIASSFSHTLEKESENLAMPRLSTNALAAKTNGDRE